MRPTVLTATNAFETCSINDFPTYVIPFEEFESFPNEDLDSLKFQTLNDKSSFFFSDYPEYKNNTTCFQEKLVYRLHVIVIDEDNDGYNNICECTSFEQISTFNAKQDKIELKLVVHSKSILDTCTFNITSGIQSSKIKTEQDLLFTHYGALKIVNYSPDLCHISMTSKMEDAQQIQRNKECIERGVYNVTGSLPGLSMHNKYGSFFDYTIQSKYIVGNVYILNTRILLNDLIYKALLYLNNKYNI